MLCSSEKIQSSAQCSMEIRCKSEVMDLLILFDLALQSHFQQLSWRHQLESGTVECHSLHCCVAAFSIFGS